MTVVFHIAFLYLITKLICGLQLHTESEECSVLPHYPTSNLWLPHRSCCAWFSSIVPNTSWPVAHIPVAMLPAFTMWGVATLQYAFYTDVFLGKQHDFPVWSTKMIEDYILSFKQGKPIESYPGGVKYITEAVKISPVTGLRGAVFGSIRPWVEAVLLALGARHVTTIEYGAIRTDHPRLSTMTPLELKMAFEKKVLEPFDFIMTFSSLEHAGLGRYGDILEPFGDLEWIERIKCILKPRSVFFFGAPMSSMDCLTFNAHRVYGPVRIEHVKRDFETVGITGTIGKDCVGEDQPIMILRKL